MTEQPFTPHIVRRGHSIVLVAFAIEFRLCGVCKTPLLPKAPRTPLFPTSMWADLSAIRQAERAKFRLASEVYHEGDPICTVCAAADTLTVECALCHEQRKASEIKESYGYLSYDYLCTLCYETVPAKQWEAAVERLEEEHKYDYT
jgi:hypothetical protein